jgi:hypothetical protein
VLARVFRGCHIVHWMCSVHRLLSVRAAPPCRLRGQEVGVRIASQTGVDFGSLRYTVPFYMPILGDLPSQLYVATCCCCASPW